MATVACRVQYLDDVDTFVCTNFPEPRRPPVYNLYDTLPLIAQVASIHKLLDAPLKVSVARGFHTLSSNTPHSCLPLMLCFLSTPAHGCLQCYFIVT